ncbi:hypothetical protein EBR66_01225 [bacterium]|nr:hypothetical protein [bacterium]
MVVRRAVEHLRTRPHHERHAVALTISVAIMAVLFFAWGYFFFARLQEQETVPVEAQPAAAAAPFVNQI